MLWDSYLVAVFVCRIMIQMIKNEAYCYHVTIQTSCASSVTDVMKLKRIHNTKKKARGNNTEKTGSVLTAMTPGLCFDFYPTVRVEHTSSRFQAHHSRAYSSYTVVPLTLTVVTVVIVSPGPQCLLGRHTGRSHPQLLLLQQSALSGYFQETLCEFFWIKTSTAYWRPQVFAHYSTLTLEVYISSL